MPNTTPSVYMSLPVPVPNVDPGTQYANDLNSCLTIIDSHTHAPGQGQQITPSGINITTDLSFGGNNAINLRSSRYTVQGGALSAGNDVGCTYITGVDLYYNDINGNQIRLTQNGGVAGTPGSIANLLFPASVTYVTGSQTFVFQSSTATAGNIDAGSIIIRPVLPNANGITLSASTNTNNYTLTIPPVLPASASFVTVDTSGNLSYSITGVAKPISGSTGAGIGSVGYSISSTSGVTGFNYTGSSFTPIIQGVTNAPLKTSINVSGVRPVFCGLTHDGSTGLSGNLYVQATGGASNATATLQLLRNTSALFVTQFGQNGVTNGLTAVPPTSISWLDFPASSGVKTYSVQIRNDNANQSLSINNIRLVVYET